MRLPPLWEPLALPAQALLGHGGSSGLRRTNLGRTELPPQDKNPRCLRKYNPATSEGWGVQCTASAGLFESDGSASRFRDRNLSGASRSGVVICDVLSAPRSFIWRGVLQ